MIALCIMTKEERAKTLVRMPIPLMERLKAESQTSGQSLNEIMVECITDGMNRREGHTLTERVNGATATAPDNIQQDGPAANIERGLITMAPDIIQDAKEAVTLYEDVPAKIRVWAVKGRDLERATDTAAMAAIQSSKPQLPNMQDGAPLDNTPALDNTPPPKHETSQAAPAAAQDDITHDALLDTKPRQSIREKITSHMETVSNIGKRLNKINLDKHA